MKLALLLLAGCGLFTRDVVRYVEVDKPTQCLLAHPADLVPWATHGPAEGCQAPWDQCLNKEEALALRADYAALIDRVVSDWTLCGAKEKP